MDDFMEKLLQEVSQETNIMNAGLPSSSAQRENAQRYPVGNQQPKGNVPVDHFQSTQSLPDIQQYMMSMSQAPQKTSSQASQQPLPHTTSQPQTQSASQPQSTDRSQGAVGSVSFEDISYFPDADDYEEQSGLPSKPEEQAMETKSAESSDSPNSKSSPADNLHDTSHEEVSFENKQILEDIRSVIHAEVLNCFKNTEAVVNDSTRNIKNTIENTNSPKKLYYFITVLLIFNIFLCIILVLHNFLGVI